MRYVFVGFLVFIFSLVIALNVETMFTTVSEDTMQLLQMGFIALGLAGLAIGFARR